MKTIIYLLFCLLSFVSTAKAQFSVSVKPFLNGQPVTTDTLETCAGTTITFKAEITPNYATVDTFDYKSASFYWNFGDGKGKFIGKNDTTVAYSFNNGGGYYVYLRIVDRYDTARVAITPVKIALAPNFKDTKSSNETSVCLGEQVTLTGQVQPPLWEFKLKEDKINNAYEVARRNPPRPDYVSTIHFGSFPVNAKIDSIETIKNIGINLEHSAFGNLTIKLMCPDSTTIILENKGIAEDTADLGTPVLISDATPGIGSLYTWEPHPTYASMKEQSLINTSALPAGSYKSEEPLSKLIGCPLNGDWTILIADTLSNDNGYIFGWQLQFHDSIKPKTNWKFENTYIKDSCEWKGDTTETTLTSYTSRTRTWKGISFATARNEDDNYYSFNVYDNFLCPQDTSLNVKVTRASFTPQTDQGEAPLAVDFDNTTDWAKTFYWDFDDNNHTGSIDKITYTYTYKDTFDVILVVKSQSGCTDTATAKITVTFPESAIKVPNVFTPNGDANSLFIVVPASAEKRLADLFVSFDCSVYNRFGRRVFHTTNPNDVDKENGGWDGSLRDNGGGIIVPGVYFYVVIGVGKDGVKRTESGSLTVY